MSDESDSIDKRLSRQRDLQKQKQQAEQDAEYKLRDQEGLAELWNSVRYYTSDDNDAHEWVARICALTLALDERGLMGRLDEPPAGLRGFEGAEPDAYHLAVAIFRHSLCDHRKTVGLMLETAKLRETTWQRVNEWLRREFREHVEGRWAALHAAPASVAADDQALIAEGPIETAQATGDEAPPTGTMSRDLATDYQIAAFFDEATEGADELTGEIRQQFLDTPRPPNVAKLAEECRAFRLLLIDGSKAAESKPVRLGKCLAVGALVLGREVVRRWWDCMAEIAGTLSTTRPPMPTLSAVDGPTAFLDIADKQELLDELKRAVDVAVGWTGCAMRCAMPQSPSPPARFRRVPVGLLPEGQSETRPTEARKSSTTPARESLDAALERQSITNEQKAHENLRAAIKVAVNTLALIAPSDPPKFFAPPAFRKLLATPWGAAQLTRQWIDDPTPQLPEETDLPDRESAKKQLESLWNWSQRTLDRFECPPPTPVPDSLKIDGEIKNQWHKSALACLDAMARLPKGSIPPDQDASKLLAEVRDALALAPPRDDPFIGPNSFKLMDRTATSAHAWIIEFARQCAQTENKDARQKGQMTGLPTFPDLNEMRVHLKIEMNRRVAPSSEMPPATTPAIQPADVTVGSRTQPMKEPPPEAIAVYRYWIATGMKQLEMADDTDLMKRLGKKTSQGTISRWLGQVRDWIRAGNVLPDLPGQRGTKPTPIEPGKIDLGERQDGHTKRQRERRSDDD